MTDHAWSDTALPAAVPTLRGAVARFLVDAGVAGGVIEAVKLAVSEALTNVVLHAYEGAASPGPVRVTTELSDSTVVVTVSDDGSGMAPRVDSPGAGLGLPLIMAVATSVEVSHTRTDGTQVSMSFAR